MHLRTTFQEALKLYPEAVAEVMQRLHGSKSKHKDAVPEEMDWTYSSYVVGKSSSLPELLESGAGTEKPAARPKTAKKRLQEQLAETHVVLMAKKGKGAQYVSSRLASVPDVVIARFKKGIEDAIREEKRVAALSPEERRREAAQAYRLLSGGGGFMAFTLPKN